MSMPYEWTERIFTRLLARYGSAWLRMWDAVPAAAMKADWSEHLAGLSAESIRYALDHLPPDRPPNVVQFRVLALGRPDATIRLPPMAPASREVVDAVLGGLQIAAQADPLAWAHRLKAREESGERLPRASREAWRYALGGPA